MVQKLGRTKKVSKVGKISEKYNILTVEEKKIPLNVNNTKMGLHPLLRNIGTEIVDHKTKCFFCCHGTIGQVCVARDDIQI